MKGAMAPTWRSRSRRGYEYLLIMLVGFLPYGLSQAYSSTLREADRTVVPMRASIYALVLGVVLNYLLIPVMGVAGAALATVVSRFAELGMNAWWTHTHPEEGALRAGRVPYAQGAGRPGQAGTHQRYAALAE